MTAARSLAAAIVVTAALLTATGCQAALDPDRDAKPKAAQSATSAPATNPSSTTSPSPSLLAEAKARAKVRAKVQVRARKARRQAALAATRAVGPVIAISVDGLNPTALTELGPARLPTFFALIRGGASTLDARTELESTETLPNHTGMLTGRPIEGPSGHHVDFNLDPGRVTVSSHAGHTIESVFDVVHRAGGTSGHSRKFVGVSAAQARTSLRSRHSEWRCHAFAPRPCAARTWTTDTLDELPVMTTTAMYASKTKFALYERSWGQSMDRAVINEDNDRLVDRLVSDLGSRPADFSFVHLSAPDEAGHASGFMGPAYLRAVEQVDRLLGRVREAVATVPALRGRTNLIVTADHGGRGTHGHSAVTKPDDYRIPFIVSGPAVRPGSDLYALNPDYRDPGGGRPSYDGEQPVRNGDLADLATRLLGMPPVPGSVFGVHDQLDVR